MAGESALDMQARVTLYQEGITRAGLSLFQDFLRVAGGLALVAVLPALGMGKDPRDAPGSGGARRE
jgi:hypothetical protein